MKERMLDVIKWGLIIIIAGAVFYVVYPKYYFDHAFLSNIPVWMRGNSMSGKVEYIIGFEDRWNEMGINEPTKKKAEKELKEKRSKVSENQNKKTGDIFDRIAEEEARKKSDPLGLFEDEDFKKPDASEFLHQKTKSKP